MIEWWFSDWWLLFFCRFLAYPFHDSPFPLRGGIAEIFIAIHKHSDHLPQPLRMTCYFGPEFFSSRLLKRTAVLSGRGYGE